MYNTSSVINDINELSSNEPRIQFFTHCWRGIDQSVEHSRYDKKVKKQEPNKRLCCVPHSVVITKTLAHIVVVSLEHFEIFIYVCSRFYSCMYVNVLNFEVEIFTRTPHNYIISYLPTNDDNAQQTIIKPSFLSYLLTC